MQPPVDIMRIFSTSTFPRQFKESHLVKLLHIV